MTTPNATQKKIIKTFNIEFAAAKQAAKQGKKQQAIKIASKAAEMGEKINKFYYKKAMNFIWNLI